MNINRFDILLIKLDPTLGTEIQKTRPCVVISPDAMNHSRFGTIIVAPMTTTVRSYLPTRTEIEFKSKKGQIALDQLRAIDRQRIVKILGAITKKITKQNINEILYNMFISSPS